MLQEMIEVLPVSMLETQRTHVDEMRRISHELGVGLGWHYLLDLSWAAAALAPVRGLRIMDAGAGLGIMQWWLAEMGADVISVDKSTRYYLPVRFRKTFRVRGLRTSDLTSWPGAMTQGLRPPFSLRKLTEAWLALLRKGRRRAGSGTVFIYNQDLMTLTDIPSASVDAVVSISALEHNPPDKLPLCVAELIRVLKPGGRLVATLGAAKDRDWFHEPSKGWCYTEATLRKSFELAKDCPSNYPQYDELFEALRGCAELRDNLADFYFKSGNNGMPWGAWNPKYQPVGVIKTKPAI